jgi:hypothetical protein
MSAVNIFTSYRQEENQFTNGLVSILSLSRLHTPEFLSSFLQTDVGIAPGREVDSFRSLDPDLVVHVGWKRVYDFFENYVAPQPPSVFSKLVRQFLDKIHDTVFAQDQAGIILKIDFGDRSEVYEDEYLAEMTAGDWTEWNTPREYKSLDGTGRKLMLYDRMQKAITVEVEIRKVKRTNRSRRYPWTNFFAPGTVHVLERPIPLARIHRIEGFENFGVHRKDRNAYRNITHEQYRELTS